MRVANPPFGIKGWAAAGTGRHRSPRVHGSRNRSVLMAPIQFLADHLEVLYDIDIGAREQARAAGMAYARIESLKTSLMR